MPLGEAEVCMQELRGSMANLSAADAKMTATNGPNVTTTTTATAMGHKESFGEEGGTSRESARGL